jgi:glutathione S-transferase
MKLYYAPGACSMAPHIALREAGLPYDLEKVDLAAKTTEGGADYAGINPKGYVPALALDDGQVLTEVSAVVQYIADRAPGSGLAPRPGTPERYKLLEWLGFIATELHKGFSPLWRPDTPDAYKPVVRDNLAKRFGYLDGQLVDRDHLMGSGFTVADSCAASARSRSGHGARGSGATRAPATRCRCRTRRSRNSGPARSCATGSRPSADRWVAPCFGSAPPSGQPPPPSSIRRSSQSRAGTRAFARPAGGG